MFTAIVFERKGMGQEVARSAEGFHVYEFTDLPCLWQGQIF